MMIIRRSFAGHRERFLTTAMNKKRACRHGMTERFQNRNCHANRREMKE
jgi:hypothetical protein